MNPKLSALARSRKLHFLLALCAFVFAIFHTFAGLGYSINYDEQPPHAVEHSYMTVLDIITSNEIVTNVKISRCLKGFNCKGPNNSGQGTWKKIPTKLNLFPLDYSLFNYYMYVEYSKANEAERFIHDVTFTVLDKAPDSQVQGSKWMKHTIAKDSYLWINYLDSVNFHVAIVREVNVLFGKQDLRDSRRHWKFDPASIPLPGRYSIQAKISMLRVAVAAEISIMEYEQQFDNVLKKNEVIITAEPRFKIMQLSDLHIGQDTGQCYEKCKFDIKTLDFIRSAIKSEQDVSFVVITGDMIDFERVAHFESVVLKALLPVLEANLPFVFTFGDSDADLRHKEAKKNVLNFVASLPGCYNKKYTQLDHRLHGMTNGNLKIYRALDGKDNEPYDFQKLKLDEADGVITYLDSESQKVEENQANFLHRLNHRLSPTVQQKLLFMHFPLPNFRPKGKVKLIGTYNEKHPLVTDTDKKFLEDVKASGYKAVAVGHEHENDACIWDETDGEKALLCYSGITGESGNTRLDPEYKRRLRVFLMNFETPRILSWKRVGDEQTDTQAIWSAEPDS